MMAFTTGSVLLAGASEGLFVTSDQGCTWPMATLTGEVRDLATESDVSHVLALTFTVQPDGAYQVEVSRSTDGSATWATVGPPLSDSVVPETIDPAPSDPNRIYVTGVESPGYSDAGATDASAPNGVGVLFRSNDGGKSWVRRSIPGADLFNPPFIAAVHPTNEGVLYARIQGSSNGVSNVQSSLLYSDDAGDSWKTVLVEPADILGFALSPDGATVLAGYGDTHDPLRPVDTTVLGIYRATAPGLGFSRAFQGQVGCLGFADGKLYVCGGHDSDGFELGVSTDVGTTVTRLFDYGDVQGPLACAPSTSQAQQCVPAWPYTCGSLASCHDGDAGANSGATSSGGCGCNSPGKSKTDAIGTTRLELTPDATDLAGALAFAAITAARRLLKRRRGRS